MTVFALDQNTLQAAPLPETRPGRLSALFSSATQAAKNTSQTIKTKINTIRHKGLRETFRKAAPALKHAGISLGTLSAVKIGAMGAAGAAGISGLGAVALGAAGVGVCATSAQYALDCYRAHKDGKPFPEFSVKNYGLKALFTSASAALGLEALNTDPETMFDKLKNAVDKIFTFFSGTAHASTNMMTEPKLAAVNNNHYIQTRPLTDDTPVSTPAQENPPVTPSTLFSGLNTEGWSKKAKDALAAAQRGQPWGMQDIAHYAANGALGNGIGKNYELAGQAALMAKESAATQGNNKILRLSTNFLNDLGKMGVLSESSQTIAPVAPEKPAATAPSATIHECDLERTVTDKYNKITMSCADPSATVNVNDVIKVTMPDEVHLYQIGKEMAERKMQLGSLFGRVYITDTNDKIERTLAQQIARNAFSMTTAEKQLASALHPTSP